MEHNLDWATTVNKTLHSYLPADLVPRILMFDYSTKMGNLQADIRVGTTSQACLDGTRDCPLHMAGLPAIDWDVVLVDAPEGWRGDRTGRVQPFYTAATIAQSRSSVIDIFSHDMDRRGEQEMAQAFLCASHTRVSQHGRLAHYQVKAGSRMPFCGA